MAITNSWLKANHKKPRSKILNKTDRDGLMVRVSVKGKITYCLRYYYKDKQTRLDIGTYPLMTLKEAREEGLRLRKQLELGHNPKTVRQLERQAIIATASLKGLFELWYESYCVKNKKGHHEILRSFELHIFPRLGKLPAEKITLHEWLDILEKLAETTPAIAERILVNAKQMLKFGTKRRLIPSNPLADIYAKEDLQVRKRAVNRSLSDEEIKMVWIALDESRITEKNKLFVKLCLIYGCRNGELRLSEKSHFDFDKNVWTIPAENHKLGKKSGKPLRRPITPEIKGYLQQAFELSSGSKYVFTNHEKNEVMGHSAPVQIPYNIMQFLRRRKQFEIPHFSMHDLRRTCRSNLSSLTTFNVAEVMLGHSRGIASVYDQHDYLEEQSEAYSAWCERLNSLVNGKPPSAPSKNNVVKLATWRRV